MGKIEAAMWVIAAATVVGIVLYTVGVFDLVYHMVTQAITKLSSSQ